MNKLPSYLHLHHHVLDSTHQWCLREQGWIEEMLQQHDYLLITTSHQTQGVGRYDKRWESSPGDLMLNLVYPEPVKVGQEYAHLSWLSLSCAVAIQRVLQRQGASLRVKWPNDLVTPLGKIAGLLVNRLTGSKGHHVTVGIGINIKPSGQPGRDFLERYGRFEGSKLAQEIGVEIYALWQQQEGFDLSHGQLAFPQGTWVGCWWSVPREPKRWIVGQVQGIDPYGSLLLQDQTGLLYHLEIEACEGLRAQPPAGESSHG